MRIDTIKIKLLMAQKDMTQEALGKMGGVSRQAISTMLGRGTCSPKNVNRMAQALGVDPAEIIKEG